MSEVEDLSNEKIAWWKMGGNTDSQGILMDQIATAPLVMSFLALSAAIIVLAEEDAGCKDLDDEESCDGTVWGVKPSSIVTLTNGIMGILSALAMPIAGAIVDYTSKRKSLGYWSAMLIIFINFLQIFVRYSWQMTVISGLLGPVLFFFHTILVMAYYPRISQDHHVLAQHISKFDSVKYVCNVTFLVILLVVATAFNAEEVDTAIVGQVLSVVISLPLMHFGWKRLSEVPSLSKIPEGSSMLFQGFKKLYQTRKQINKTNKPLKWFMRSIIFGAPAMTSFVFVGPSFTIEFMDFDAGQNIAVVIALTLSAVPGALICRKMFTWKNPLFTCRFFQLLAFISSFICAALVTDEDDIVPLFIYVCLLGCCIGGYFTAESALFACVIPRDQEAELMGYYMFASRVCIWLPPIIFTIANESDADLNKAMVLVHSPSLIFFLLSLPMGSFEDVVAASSAHKQVRKATMDVSAKEDSESDEVESNAVDKDLEVEISEK